ncbi:hypothetical protein E4U22_002817 [Claviceps purpurea]|nr:hypothetical protein E4U22_002817 [Claviceps purpurea]
MIGDDEFWRQLRAAEARALEAERKREAAEEWALEVRGLRLETGLDGQFVIELSHVMDKSHQTGDVFVSESRSLAAAVIAQLYAAMI